MAKNVGPQELQALLALVSRSTAQVLALGKRADELIEAAAAIGPIYHESIGPDYLRTRPALRQAASSGHEQQLPDGRWLRVRENAILDGGSDSGRRTRSAHLGHSVVKSD